MSTQQIKVGNVILEIQGNSSIPPTRSEGAKKIIAERGDEVEPIENFPSIPNPNDFIGATFQVHAIGKIGTSEKKWVNRTGMLIFGVIPVVSIELLSLWAWIANGRWLPFVAFTAVFAFILLRKDKPTKTKNDG